MAFFSNHLSEVQQITLIAVLNAMCNKSDKDVKLYLLDASTEWMKDARVLLDVIVVWDSANKNIRIAVNLGEASLPRHKEQQVGD